MDYELFNFLHRGDITMSRQNVTNRFPCDTNLLKKVHTQILIVINTHPSVVPNL